MRAPTSCEVTYARAGVAKALGDSGGGSGENKSLLGCRVEAVRAPRRRSCGQKLLLADGIKVEQGALFTSAALQAGASVYLVPVRVPLLHVIPPDSNAGANLPSALSLLHDAAFHARKTKILGCIGDRETHGVREVNGTP